MTNVRKQHWTYVRASKAFMLKMWLGGIAFLGGGTFVFATLVRRDSLFEQIFAGTFSILFGSVLLWMALTPRLKFNEDRVSFKALPFWSLSYFWSDLTHIDFDSENRLGCLLFGPGRPLELSKLTFTKFRVWSTPRRVHLHRDGDVLELTTLAQQKLKENLSTPICKT